MSLRSRLQSILRSALTRETESVVAADLLAAEHAFVHAANGGREWLPDWPATLRSLADALETAEQYAASLDASGESAPVAAAWRHALGQIAAHALVRLSLGGALHTDIRMLLRAGTPRAEADRLRHLALRYTPSTPITVYDAGADPTPIAEIALARLTKSARDVPRAASGTARVAPRR